MQGKSNTERQMLDAAAFCRQLVPDDSVQAFLADHRRELFTDEDFSDLFPSGKGRPSIPVEVICSVMVLQALEGLSDRDAIRQLRTRIDWKVACGLALDDEGFDPSVLTYWRARLRRSERPERVFEAVRKVVDETGVIARRHRRALDSTVLDDAVATQDTVTQLISQVRRVIAAVPSLSSVRLSHDYAAVGKPLIDWNDPEERETIVSVLVADAIAILEAVSDLELTPEQVDAVGLLALVSSQDVEPGDDEGSWRIAWKVAKDRVISTVDPESRHAHKSVSVRRDGFKAHLCVEPETGIVTAAALTPANTPDGQVVGQLLAGEEAGLLVLADSAYGSGPTRAALRAAGHRQAIKPAPLARAVPGGFTIDDFVIDEEGRTVTCPAGHAVPLALSRAAKFGPRCTGCSFRERCTRSSSGKRVVITPDHAELVEARREWREKTFLAEYRTYRPMVERGMAWLVANNNRRLRYRGVERNDVWLKTRVAALNLRRLVRLGLAFDGAWRLSGA
jgi:IS5 family transposase